MIRQLKRLDHKEKSRGESHAADIAMMIGLRGMDAIVIQIATQFQNPVIFQTRI